MIGKIHFSSRNQPLVAVLENDGRWVCENESFADLLNLICPPTIDWYEDPQLLGRHILYQAAERLGGRVELNHQTSSISHRHHPAATLSASH